jgi:hypothetical protein
MRPRTCPSRKRLSLAVSIVFTTVLVALVLLAGHAWAQARKTTITCNPDGSVSYRISGVGNADLCVVTETTFTARCICQSNSGNCPASANKRTTSFPVSESEVAQPRNGQITDTVSLDAPTDADCQAALSCPSGQHAILAQYTQGAISVDVFDFGDFSTSDSTCTPNTDANPIRSGSCRPSPRTVTLNQQCASRF